MAYALKGDIMSNSLVLLRNQLEFWFQKKPQGFYKFLKPCDHRLYTIGDSWCEQLNLSENTFRKYLKKICKSYPSKESFLAESDPFEGMPYASYFDRLKKITFFFRNHEVAETFSLKKILYVDCAPICVSNNTVKNIINNNPPKSPLRQVVNEGRGEDIKKYLLKNLSESDLQTAQRMRDLWVEATKGAIETPKVTEKFAEKLLDVLKKFFQNSLEIWRKYCEAVASSQFLMGKLGTFKAWLIWVIRDDIIPKIKSGAYGIDPKIFSEEVDTTPEKKEKISLTLNSLNLSSKNLEVMKRLEEETGVHSFTNWFLNCTIEASEKALVFYAPNYFSFDYMRQKFEDILEKMRSIFKDMQIELKCQKEVV